MNPRLKCVKDDAGLSRVLSFHEAFDFPIALDVRSTGTEDGNRLLRDLTIAMAKVAEEVRLGEEIHHDPRVARAQLIMEELSEVLQALERRDEPALADGVADLDYVVRGTAVCFGLPLERLHLEVHLSNMSKDQDGEHKPAKGARYRAPQIAKVLEGARR